MKRRDWYHWNRNKGTLRVFCKMADTTEKASGRRGVKLPLKGI